MLREIIKPTSNTYTIHLPDEYLNREIEILILPFSRNDKKTEKNIPKRKKSLAGSLKKYANPDLIEKEKDIAWEEVAKEKSAVS